MHMGLACPELSGHLNPMTTLGRELVRRGHRVTLVSRPDGEAKAMAAGLGFAEIGAREFPRGAIPGQALRLGGMTSREALRYTIDMMRLAAEVTLRDLPGVIHATGIEALLVDQVNPAAGTTAEITRLPFVKVCNALALNRDPGCPPAVLPWRYRPGPPLDAQLVISLGSADQDAAAVAGHCPGSPIVVSVAPQLALLEKATLAITHAGLNTALEALARGVPMVAIPITNDQPGVARRLEWLGLAEVLLPRRLTAARLRATIARVLGDSGYRERARERAREIAHTDGVARAADIIEMAFSTGAPVTGRMT